MRRRSEPASSSWGSMSSPRVAALALWFAVLSCKRDAPAQAEASASASPRCEVVDARGGKGGLDLDAFADPIARLVLDGACPADLDAIAARLDERDAAGCPDDGFSPMRAMLVSERAQLRGTADGSTQECSETPVAIFRAVLQRPCAGRPAHGLFLSVAPLATIQTALPPMVEAIGFDPVASRFRFYTLESGTWHYHGDSIDMLAGPSPEGARRCAACHVGGGLVMKELDTPWVHWEGRVTTPGVDALLHAHPALGSRTHGKVTDFRPAGKELQDAIVEGNRAWVRERIRYQREHAPLPALLRPLFCDDEFNVRAAAESATPAHATSGERGRIAVPIAGLLAPERLAGPEVLSIEIADYHAAIVASRQRGATMCDNPLRDGDGRPVVDAAFDFTYPHRAAIDEMAVDALVDEGIVDEAFVRAVLAVDLTRPLCSPARCSLLERVPDLPAERRSPTAIREAVAAALAGVELPAAAELLANLGPTAPDPSARVAAFVRACEARTGDGALVADLVAYASHLRNAVRARPIVELPEMLPIDELPTFADLHFDATTCELIRAPAL